MKLKCSPRFSRAVRSLLGTAHSPGLDISSVRLRASQEQGLVLAFGEADQSIPGEQKHITRSTLEAVVRDEPKERLIILHCD
jgi:hypothetical protein